MFWLKKQEKRIILEFFLKNSRMRTFILTKLWL